MVIVPAPHQRPGVERGRIDDRYRRDPGSGGRGQVGRKQREAIAAGLYSLEEFGHPEVETLRAAGDAEPVGKPPQVVQPLRGGGKHQRASGQFGRTERVTAGQCVPFADHGVQRLEPDQPAGHAVQRVARAARVHPAEPDVDLASGQGGQGGRQVTGPTELNVQLGGVLKGLSNGAQGRVQMTPHVNPKRAFLVSRRCRRQVADCQQAPGRGKEPAARFRQRDPGGAPGQQPYAQFGFQPRHALGQSLLTHGQRGRSTTEMPLVGHRDERPYPRQIKVHSPATSLDNLWLSNRRDGCWIPVRRRDVLSAGRTKEASDEGAAACRRT
jgi:hypothetical protein